MTRTRLYDVHGAQPEGFALPGADASYAPDLALEPIQLEIRLRFDLERASCEGTVTTTVRANRAGARALDLDAIGFEEVEVSSPDPLAWRYDGTRIGVCWEEPLRHGDERKVTVRYRVQGPIAGMRFSRPDEHYPDRPLFVATDHETERARYWLPCVDFPTVRPRYDFHLTADSGLTCVASGVSEGSRENDDGTTTHHWKLDYPCPSYLACLAIGRFVELEDGDVEGCPLRYLTVESFGADPLRRSFGRTAEMMRWLIRRLGHPFPFPKYSQIALPEIGGAMENISLVTWDSIFLLDEQLAQEWGHVVDSVNIHEMAHSYFGDAVVCRHFEHSWLKESWATYVETLWWEETLGRDERDLDLVLNAERYFEESDDRYARPIVTREYSSSWDLFDAHLYPGGAWRIHMLRKLLGDDDFFAAVGNYIRRYSQKVVETEDFRRELEATSGLNLTRFFDQWIYRPGYPKLKVTFAHDAERGEGTLTVEQTQMDDARKIGRFDFALEVEWHDDEGAHRRTLDISDAKHAAVFPMPDTPRRISVDPDLKTLCSLEFNPGDDLLRRSLDEAPELAVRLWAARALIGTGTPRNLQLVDEAMERTSFWGLRALVAKAFGDSGSAGAVEPLRRMLAREEDPRPKAMIARACGAIRDPRLAAALEEFLSGEQPPWARGAAATSLGAQRDAEHFATLAAVSGDPGVHGIARAGALRGLGRLRSEAALELLEKRVAYGVEPEDSRPAAVDGLGTSAALQQRDRRRGAIETLVDLTRDPSERVRRRAAVGIAVLPEAPVADALGALKMRHPAQDTPFFERLIMKHRRGSSGNELPALRKQVEELESRSRKLEERLLKLEAHADEKGGSR